MHVIQRITNRSTPWYLAVATTLILMALSCGSKTEPAPLASRSQPIIFEHPPQEIDALVASAENGAVWNFRDAMTARSTMLLAYVWEQDNIQGEKGGSAHMAASNLLFTAHHVAYNPLNPPNGYDVLSKDVVTSPRLVPQRHWHFRA